MPVLIVSVVALGMCLEGVSGLNTDERQRVAAYVRARQRGTLLAGGIGGAFGLAALAMTAFWCWLLGETLWVFLAWLATQIVLFVVALGILQDLAKAFFQKEDKSEQAAKDSAPG